jgi:hypothetical protein
MSNKEIYQNFSEIIKWITQQIKYDQESLPKELQDQANYFLKERLIILINAENLKKAKSLDPRVGRPIPYIIMWLADAFGYREDNQVREIALGLVYSAIATTIRDDFYDEAYPEKFTLRLYDHYFLNYLSSFDSISNKSDFWYLLTSSIKQHKKYDIWSINYIPAPNLDSLSDDFLDKTSKYFSAVVLPSMAAIAILSGNEDKIDEINNFLTSFSKAWRIYDDFVDWEKDIHKANFNLNSILLRAYKIKKDLEKDDFLLLLLEEEFISDIYDSMIKNFNHAKSSLENIYSKYLEQFLLEQIEFHTERKKTLLESSRKYREDFFKEIEKIMS